MLLRTSYLLFLVSFFGLSVLASEADSMLTGCGKAFGPDFQSTMMVPINALDNVEVTFVWKAGTYRNVEKEAWVVEMIQGTRARYPYLLIPLNLKVILTEEKNGFFGTEWGLEVIEVPDSPNFEIFRSIALHEWAHHLIGIRLHRNKAFSGEERTPVSRGIEEFLADLYAVLWMENFGVFRSVVRELWSGEQNSPFQRAFINAWSDLRGFDQQWKSPQQFETRMRGLCRAAAARSPKNGEFSEVHGYFGWLRGEVGNHWEEVSKDKAAFFERALAAAAYWDASFRPDEGKDALLREIMTANRMFASILGLIP